MAGGGGGGAGVAAPRSKFKSPVATKRARIEIIPLIDVMFFLLAAFMMVSLSLQKMKTPRMDLAVARTGVRYFHPADREAAQAVRRAVAVFEGGWEVGLSDFTGYDPPPRDGTVEVWVRPSG